MRGRYRILLGMAAGVGKTYRMLQEGRQAQAEGRDVVIGYLEPHDRPETAALAEGLEAVPRLRVSHGALEIEEMDVDAVVRRAPELALVDELAHTNAPGVAEREALPGHRRDPRAGIDVVSTVNIQHLESLNDAVFELTGVRVRETFPDRMLERRRRGRPRRYLAGGAAGASAGRQGLPARPGRQGAAELLPPGQPLRIARARAREVAEDVEARRSTAELDPLSKQAVAERVSPSSSLSHGRSASSVAHGARLSASAREIDALWIAAGKRALGGGCDAARRAPSAGIDPRRAFLEEEGDDLVARYGGSSSSAARPTSSSAPRRARAGLRSCAARWSRG